MEDLKQPDRVLIGGEQSADGKAAMEVRPPARLGCQYRDTPHVTLLM